jgi:signal transduction histidine kinase
MIKRPAFTKTIRFRLALWYSMSFLVLYVLILGGINLAVGLPISEPSPTAPTPEDQTRAQLRREQQRILAGYSVIGFAAVLALGGAGSYLLSGRMLRPVDRVSTLASRISHTNLKERIRHEGPDDEVKRLSDTFDDMLERLEGAFESQKQFLQDASHELRTPIAIAQTNVEVLEMQEDPTAKDYEHLMQVLKMSLERMNSVNEGLLLLAEGRQTQYKWSEVDMGSLAREIVDEASGRAEAAQVHLEVEIASGDVRVMGDSTRLKQAIMNLVDNAVKYNKPGGKVKISAKAEGTVVSVEVHDTGIGISQADLPRVFERFYRVDKSRSRSMGGSGLGLSIVKKIIEDHKGAITADSNPGEGSTFRIVLPRHV